MSGKEGETEDENETMETAVDIEPPELAVVVVGRKVAGEEGETEDENEAMETMVLVVVVVLTKMTVGKIIHHTFINN